MFPTSYIIFHFLLLLTFISTSITDDIICVELTGTDCPFKRIQSAVDSIPAISKQRVIIHIRAGIYLEKIVISKEKPPITFQGDGYLNTVIIWNDTAKSAGGTFYSGTVQIFSANFIAKNITFKNSAPPPAQGVEGAQAVAVRVGGDMAAFWGCGFYGAQDTLHDDQGRHYFRDCHIEGSIDFIFGMAKSFYENCYLVSIAATSIQGSITGAITANGKSTPDEDSGFVFYRCNINGTGSVYLGRAWRPYSQVVYVFTDMSTAVAPVGWSDWGNATNDRTVFYGEYNCSGRGSKGKRVDYAKKLTNEEVKPFISLSYIEADKWLEPFA